MNRFFFLSIVLAMLSWYGCADDCENVNCENGGICIDGRCDCPEGFTGQRCEVELDPCLQLQCANADTCLVDNQGRARCVCQQGYEGIRCDSLWVSKYLGRFNVDESCGSTNTFSVDITSGPRFGAITIANFHNQAGSSGTAKVVAEALTANNLIIPVQFMHFGQVEGSGSFGPGFFQFTLNYTIINNQDTTRCSAIFAR
jgi:hypothetical protein